MECNSKIPFLDTVIHRQENVAKFSVYRKPTNKDDFVHYLSAHSERTKRGVVIGFFLRAIRVCSDEFIEEEFKYIVDAFRKLGYPAGLLYNLKKKAMDIANRKETRSDDDNVYIIVPYSSKAKKVDNFLSRVGIKIAYQSGTKIGDLVKQTIKNEKDVNSVIYKIPCSGCSRSYYGETSRGVDKRIYEHKNDIRHHRTSNSLVVHVDEEGHLPHWQGVKVLHEGLSKKMRKTVEAAYITTEKATNHRDGFVSLAGSSGRIIISETSVVDPGGQVR